MLQPAAMQMGTTALADWLVILPVALGLGGAAVLLMLRRLYALQAPLALALIALIVLSDFGLFRRVLADGPVAMTMGNWLPPFGITFAADAMGAGFALVAAAATLLVMVYHQIEKPAGEGSEGFYPLVLLLLAGVSGSFLTGDLFNLYVWFEVMLIASFGLLVFRGRTIELDATVKYGLINFIATALFLVALGLLYGVLGTLNMADIIARAAAADPATLAPIAAVLVLAFGIKAAAFPVNAWLPAAYHAPSPAVSALLAGLPTKVGVYALLRTFGMLLPHAHDTLEAAFVAVAVATLVLAPIGAIAETNLRRSLGFFVIGGIGAAIAGLALPGPAGFSGAIVYVAQAMATMTSLYLLAGLIEKATGEIDTRRMGGFYAGNSALSVLFVVLILGVAGVPPFLGFWAKLLLLQGALGAPFYGGGSWIGGLIASALLLNALLTLIAGTRLWSHIFWRPGPLGPLSDLHNPALRPLAGRELGFGLGSVGVLTTVIGILGLWPEPLLAAGQIAAASLLDPSRYIAAVGLGAQP